MIRHGLFGLFCLVVLAAMTWPGYAWLGTRIEPYVLGLPFALAWVVGWVLVSFVGLVLFHATGRTNGE